MKERVLTMNGVSKSYAMTGWRIGYAAGAKEIIKAIAKIQSQSTSNPSSVSQAAAVEALSGKQDFIFERSKAFQERRDFVVSELNKINGINCLKPEGAFYVFPNISYYFGKNLKNKTINNATDFSLYLLEEANVATVTGDAFGDKNCIRISYAASVSEIKEALKRIKEAVS